MYPFNDNGRMLFPKPFDEREGFWNDGIEAWDVYGSVQDALDALEYRYTGQEIPVIVDGRQTTYWFVGGTDDGDFVEKTPDMSDYYTKEELQTSGDAEVHWDNLTNVPPVQSPLTFENGLREDGGVVKLGTADGSSGVLTEPTVLLYGNVTDGTLVSLPSNKEIHIGKIVGGGGQRLWFHGDANNNEIHILDSINQKGIQYASTYDGTSDPLWIPHWGAVTDYVDTEIGDIPTPTLQSVTDAGNSSSNLISITGNSGGRAATGINIDRLSVSYGSTGLSALRFNFNDGFANGTIISHGNESTMSTGRTGLAVQNQDSTTPGAIFYGGGSSGVTWYRRVAGAHPINANDFVTLGYYNTDIAANYIPLSQKAQANGVATLDGGGKVPLTQLPAAIMIYRGTWDASNNTPTLANGIGTAGDVYRVSVAGDQDLGSGVIDFEVGDYVIYNGTSWEKSDTTDAVASIFGRVGNVVAVESDYQSFYPRLSQSYDNPSWINSLAYSKLTGAPDLGDYLPLSGNSSSSPMTGSLYMGDGSPGMGNQIRDLGALIFKQSDQAGIYFPRDINYNAGTNATIARRDGHVSVASTDSGTDGWANLSTDLISTSPKTFSFPNTSGTFALTSDIEGVYLPLAGGTMSGDIDMGENSLNNIYELVVPSGSSGSDGFVRIQNIGGSSAYSVPQIEFVHGGYRRGAITGNTTGGNQFGLGFITNRATDGSSTPSYKMRLFEADNSSNPNINVAQFYGSVTGRMDGTSDPDGYESQFATQDYVDAEIGNIDFTTLPGFGLSWNSTTNKIDWGTTVGQEHGLVLPQDESLSFLYNSDIGIRFSPLGVGGNMQINNDKITFTYGGGEVPVFTADSDGIVVSGNNFRGIRYSSDYSANYTDRSLPDVGWVNSQITSATNLQAVTDNGATTTNGIQALSYATSGGSVLDANLSTDDIFTTGDIQATGGVYSTLLVQGTRVIATDNVEAPFVKITGIPTALTDAATVGWVNGFGLGSVSYTLSPASAWDSFARPTGFYRSSSASNSPFDAFGTAIHIQFSSDRAGQLFIPGGTSTNGLQWRSDESAGVWRNIRTLWDDENLPNPWNNSIVGGGWDQPEAAGTFRTISSTTGAPSGIGGGLYGAFFASATAGYGTYMGGRNNSFFFKSLNNGTHGAWFEVVTSGSDQTIEGNKEWIGNQYWTPASNPTIGPASIAFVSGTGGSAIKVTQLSSQSNSVLIRGYESSGVQMVLYDGGINANGAYTDTSDIRLKDTLEYDYASVADLDAITYTWKDNRDNGRIHVGYSAQDVQQVLPDAVYIEKDEEGNEIEGGKLSVDKTQVLIAKVGLLEQKIKQLEAQLN